MLYLLIMIKQKLIILLIGIICFGSIGGFFWVTCHGSDGHITAEPVFHNHCECPETAMCEHNYCKDTVSLSNFIIPTQKNVKSSTDKIFTTNLLSELFLTHNALKRITASINKSSFFEALQTVILIV